MALEPSDDMDLDDLNNMTNLDTLENNLQNIAIPGDTPLGDQHEHSPTAGYTTGGGLWETSGGYHHSSWDKPVATSEDFLDYGRYLNQTLSVHGIPHPYPGHIDFNFPEERHKIQVVNTLLELVQNEQRQKQFIHEANDMIQALQNELRDCTEKYRKLQTERKDLKQSNETLKQKQTQMQNQSEKAIKIQKAKVKKLTSENSALKFKDKQYKAEIRAKAQVVSDLKKKLNVRLNGMQKVARNKFGMKNPLKHEVFKTGKRTTVDELNARIARLTDQLESQKEQLHETITENSQLRESFMNLQLELKDHLNDDDDFAFDEEFEEENEHIIEQLEMPFDLVRGNLEGEMLSDLHRIKQKQAAGQKKQNISNHSNNRGGINSLMNQRNISFGQDEDFPPTPGHERKDDFAMFNSDNLSGTQMSEGIVRASRKNTILNQSSSRKRKRQCSPAKPERAHRPGEPSVNSLDNFMKSDARRRESFEKVDFDNFNDDRSDPRSAGSMDLSQLPEIDIEQEFAEFDDDLDVNLDDDLSGHVNFGTGQSFGI